MSRPLTTCLAAALLAWAAPAPAQTAEEINRQSAQLEADLKKTLETSPNGAKALLALVDHYYQHGRVFGLVRSARKFAAAQPSHPRHKEVMVKLVDGLLITSRHEELLSAARQFLGKYGDTPEAAHVERQLASTYEAMGRTADAAAAYRSVSARLDRGGVEDGLKALDLYRGIENKEAFQATAELAGALLDLLPADGRAAEVGWLGHRTAQRYSDWARSNAIANKTLAKNAPLDKDWRRQLLIAVGDNNNHLGQRTNALAAYRKALALEDSADLRRRIVDTLAAAEAKPGQLRPEVAEFLKRYPGHDDRWPVAAALAEAYARAGDLNNTLAATEKVLVGNPEARNLRSHFLGWLGDEPKPADLARAETALKNAIAKRPGDSWRLRWTLGLDLYDKRLKDTAKAKAAVREMLFAHPGNDSGLKSALDWLLKAAASEEEFQADVRRAAAAMREFVHLGQYRDILGSWAHDNRQNKDLRARAKFAADQYQAVRDSEFVRRWRDGEKDRGGGKDSRLWLLGQDLSPAQRRSVLSRHAYDIRHHGHEKHRAEAVRFYREYHGVAEDKAEAARLWQESAAHYGTEEDIRAATGAVLAGAPYYERYLWRNLAAGAGRAKDPALARKVVAWIGAYEKAGGTRMDHAGEIGDLLLKLELENEALAYWRAHAIPGKNHYEAQSCAGKLLAQIPKENVAARIALIGRMLAPDTDQFGAYASWLADEYFRSGDLANFEKTLAEARKRQDGRPFRHWGLGEWPAQGWLDHCWKTEEMPDEQKVVVFRAVRDLKIGRTSSAAALSLLAIGRSEAVSPTAKLLALARATRIGDRSSYAWDRMWPAAQKLYANRQYAGSAVLLTGMLQNLRDADRGRKEGARDLIRKAYAGMGALGFDIDNNSPVAPLLHISLHRRLGDEEPAVETYHENRGLFDEHRDELPAEIVAFAGEIHIDEGGDEAHDRAEDILRGWMIKNGEDPKIDAADKAQIGFLLAKNYHRAGRYEAARAEYTSVVNQYPRTDAAVEAKFGIGETFMAQKIFDKAEEIFTALGETRVPKIVLRSDFLRGVLAVRRGDREAARSIFRDVLARMPDIELADRTLYELAEVYGLEQRFLDQLDLLRTVGRLGRDSKRWHVPGRALSIVVQDTDLGISRGHTKIPVVVRTEPGGDEEPAFLTSGGAGKGLFMGEVPTVLGAAQPRDKILQVTGADLITVDYPEDFKEEFRFDLLANNQIRLGADASFQIASARILPDDEGGFTDELRREIEEQELDKRKSSARPAGQVKPGNLIYFRAEDPDRNLGGATDSLPVKLVASSGDQVEVVLTETAPHSAVFEGSVRSGELPAGALASDQAIGHSPLMAIDNDPATAWLTEPDGVAPKWLLVDMKELNTVDTVTVRTPNPEKGAPVRLRLEGSHDGRYFYHLAEFPAPEPDKIPAGEFGAMRQRVWKVDNPEFTRWSQVTDLAEKGKPVEESEVEALSWNQELPADAGEEERKAAAEGSFAVLWHGKFLQPKDGAVRFGLGGTAAAAMVNGRVVLEFGGEEATADVFLRQGIHEIALFATTTGTTPASAQRARENPNSPAVVMLPFSASDLDLDSPFGKELAAIELEQTQPTASAGDGAWTFKLDPIALRHLRVIVDEYLGESVAVSQVEISGGEERYIPTGADILALAENDILEIAPGDTVTGSYVDEFTNDGVGRNRVLTGTLTATYYNGSVRPISYDFNRARDGSVRKTRKDLLRIDPGERITIEVTDYDMDTTGGKDTVPIKIVAPGNGPVELTATEIGDNAGLFRTEIDTAAAPEAGKLAVKPGDQIYIRYRDPQNTFPGHAVEREAVVYVRVPTEGRIRVVESRVIPPLEGSEAAPQTVFLPTADSPPDTVRGVAYGAPLTIEVIDPDAARDSNSSVVISLDTGSGEPLRVACRVSSAYGEIDPALAEVSNPALHQGRFVGQIAMRLGGPDSPRQIPATDDVPTGLIGRVLPPETEEGEGPEVATGAGARLAEALVHVLNLTGEDIVAATYHDADRPDGNPQDLGERARMISDGTIAITDKEYEEPAEILYLGERLYLQVEDADRDLTDERDRLQVLVTTSGGEEELVELEETLSHSGVFTASFGLAAQGKPTKGNLSTTDDKRIEGFFDEELTATYVDETPAGSTSALPKAASAPIARGTDGLLAAFSKVFNDDELAIQTQFHIAESYFELFKSHLELKRDKEAAADLKAGRKVLRELAEDYPDPRYTPRIEYLLGNFSQEMEEWDQAIGSYRTIVRDFPEHTLAADAQYKLGQCFEKAGQFDDALEAYVTLAASYPNSPLIASVMMRINEHFYRDEDYLIAASVAEKFLERFDGHEHAPRMAFRAGQCYYKAEDYGGAGETFDEFVKDFPDDDLTAQALFWSGESYRMGGKIPEAFWRYNRCRTDFPESEAAKYSRGRLALPELLAQFEREAAAIENE